MPRFEHPTDKRVHVEYGADETGLVVEVWFVGDRERPTLSFSSTGDEPWDAEHPIYWQAVDRLCLLGFLSVSEVHDATEALDGGVLPSRMPKRLRLVAELVQNLREVCG